MADDTQTTRLLRVMDLLVEGEGDTHPPSLWADLQKTPFARIHRVRARTALWCRTPPPLGMPSHDPGFLWVRAEAAALMMARERELLCAKMAALGLKLKEVDLSTLCETLTHKDMLALRWKPLVLVQEGRPLGVVFDWVDGLRLFPQANAEVMTF